MSPPYLARFLSCLTGLFSLDVTDSVRYGDSFIDRYEYEHGYPDPCYHTDGIDEAYISRVYATNEEIAHIYMEYSTKTTSNNDGRKSNISFLF